MRKVPLKFEYYDHSIVQNNYVLSDLDKFFLNVFKEYYEERKDELDNICIMIPSSDLKKLLGDGTWMDTNIMYYYFEILWDECESYFIADPSVCMQSWWSDDSDSAVEVLFRKHGHRVMDAREARTLVFVVHHRSHFTLLVEYVDERRWELCNSMASDRQSVKQASKFLWPFGPHGFVSGRSPHASSPKRIIPMKRGLTLISLASGGLIGDVGRMFPACWPGFSHSLTRRGEPLPALIPICNDPNPLPAGI